MLFRSVSNNRDYLHRRICCFPFCDLVLSVLDPNYVRFGQGGKKNAEKSKKIEKNEDNVEIKEIEYKPIEIEGDLSDLPEELNKENEINESIVNDESIAEELISSDLIDLKAEEEMFKERMLKEIEERRKMSEHSEPEEIDFENFFFGDDDNLFWNKEIKNNEDVYNIEDIEDAESVENKIEETDKKQQKKLQKQQKISQKKQ